ncbi:MAG: ATP-binding protein [Peptostreptococcaceae bacterium]
MIGIRGLKKRIILNFFIIIMITITLFISIFTFYIQNYYYEYVRQSLKNQAHYTKLTYNSLTGLDNASFEYKIKDIIEKQSVDDQLRKFSIQIIDSNRNLIIDQYGFKENIELNYEDINRALKDEKNLVPYTYRIRETNEYVMSISVPIKLNNKIEGVVRYTISLTQINKTVTNITFGILFASFLILLIVISISIRLANTIINPIVELRQLANELAHGNFNVELDKIKISDDEIGDLAHTLIYMASEIDKSEKLKEEFISSISHELRTPLTSIKGWSETLGYEEIRKEELDLGLSIIQDETERLIKLVEELLDFSRLSSDRIKLRIDTLNLKILCLSVVNQLKVKANKKGIDISVNFLDENIENIQGDKDRLRQVLINLIQNSLKSTNENGFIKIEVNQDIDYTTIKVIDNGHGIEKENLKKVLDKFFQEDYNKAGSGLGLAISHEIVKLHGGSMDITSEKNIRTEIKFTLKNKL